MIIIVNYDLFYCRMTRQWLSNEMIFSLTAKGKEQAKLLKILHGFTENVSKNIIICLYIGNTLYIHINHIIIINIIKEISCINFRL